MTCYSISVCVIGLTLLFTLIYGLTLSNDTVSNNMLTFIPYRIVLSTCILVQISIWAVCLYSKRVIDPDTSAWGLLSVGSTICCWVGLSTILSGNTHFVFVALFIGFFLISLLILCNLTWQRRAVTVLITSVAILLLCIIIMTILFNNKEFYIMEHIAFITYSLIFVVFFLAHTPEEWGAEEEFQDEENAHNTLKRPNPIKRQTIHTFPAFTNTPRD